MQMTPFPAHYQLVYTNFDFSSFSRISCPPKMPLSSGASAIFIHPKCHFYPVLALRVLEFSSTSTGV